MIEKLQMEHVLVGMFRLPGVKFGNDYAFTSDILDEMEEWSEENKCGMRMTDSLWSFKNEDHKQWFLLRWSDTIHKCRIYAEED